MARRSTTAATPQRAETGPRKKTAKARRSKGPSVDVTDSAFVNALSVDFRCHGAAAISRLREDDPVSYIKMCASILPKAVIDGLDPLDALTDDELFQRARRLAQKAGLGHGPDPDGAGKTEKPE